MNRRQFLRALAVASAAVPSACTVTTPPAAESAPAASANSLALAAKRYDGRSGAAVFTGCIPLKPGQIFESDLTPITLWEGNTELGLTVSALWPQHPDGSVKVIQCHTTLTLASGVTKALTLRLDRTRTVTGPAAATINEAWMKQPRLLACTDATHLCASRVAGLPLVPIPNPALPARWNTWLTTEFDLPGLNPNWGAIKARVMADDPNSIGGAANYNVGHLMYCRYLTSGNLDHLYEAHHVMQFAPGSPIPMRWNTLGGSGGEYPAGHIMHTAPPGHDADRTIVYYGEAYGGHAKDSPFQTVFENWAIAGDPGGSSGMVGDSEHYSGFRADYFTCYCLAGWPQALGTLLGTCLGKFPRSPAGAFPGALQPWSQILANENLWHGVYFLNYGGRAQWRHMRNPDLYYLLLSPPMALYSWYNDNSKSMVIPSPRTHKQDVVNWVKWDHFDAFEAWPTTYPATGAVTSFLRPIWGMSSYFTGGATPEELAWAQGGRIAPDFQFHLLFWDVFLAYYNFLQDARVPAAMWTVAEFMRRQCVGPVPVPGTRGGKQGYYQPYLPRNPDVPGDWWGDRCFWSTQANLVWFAWGYAYSGSTLHRDLADACADLQHDRTGNGSTPYATWKEFGEQYSMAFHAAAWRAGVPYNGWDLG